MRVRPNALRRLTRPVQLLSFGLMLLLLTAVGANAQVWRKASQLPLCAQIAPLPPATPAAGQVQVSAGARMTCFGPQNGSGTAAASTRLQSGSTSGNGSKGKGSKNSFTGTNMDAATPVEDQINGTQSYGQSETSIAAIGPYVVEAWNDATAFFAPSCSPSFKDQLTGFGFSSDGGATFTDLGGLPNINCSTSVFEGDPSVEAFQSGGHTYFYISSLFFDAIEGATKIEMDACEVVGSSLSCNQTPIVIADPGQFGFDDKDFMSIDADRGLLYVTYTNFTFTANSFDQIQLSVCDIGNGALGGTPLHPVCNSAAGPTPAYLTLAAAPLSSCAEIEGSYPAVDPGTGDIYAAYEFNWATNLSPFCPVPVQNVLVYVAANCIALPNPSPCSGPTASTAVNITSMAGAFIAGYNRFPGNDFPRLAVSDTAGTVSMVWNDASNNTLGNVVMQSFDLASLARVQSAPVKLDNDGIAGNLHFLPAVRNADANGNLNVTWYDRRLSPNSALTDVYAALGVNPRTTSTPKANARVTSVSSNWLAVSSDIVPNFGDYTDNYVELTSGKKPSAITYAAWSDGRINDPQPFNAHQ